MNRNILLCCAPPLLLAYQLAGATSFQKGGFETGTADGWTTGEGDRTTVLNSAIGTADFLPGGSRYAGPATSRSPLIAAGTVEPILGSLLGSTVYAGNNAYRAEPPPN